jgi:hypothetical protein
LSTPVKTSRISLNPDTANAVIIDTCAFDDLHTACNNNSVRTDIPSLKSIIGKLNVPVLIPATIGHELFGKEAFDLDCGSKSLIESFDRKTGEIKFKDDKACGNILNDTATRNNKNIDHLKVRLAALREADIRCVITDACTKEFDKRVTKDFHGHSSDTGERAIADLVQDRKKYGIPENTHVAVVSNDRGTAVDFFTKRTFDESRGNYKLVDPNINTRVSYEPTALSDNEVKTLNASTHIMSSGGLIDAMNKAGSISASDAQKIQNGHNNIRNGRGDISGVINAKDPTKGILQTAHQTAFNPPHPTDTWIYEDDVKAQYNAADDFSKSLKKTSGPTLQKPSIPAAAPQNGVPRNGNGHVAPKQPAPVSATSNGAQQPTASSKPTASATMPGLPDSDVIAKAKLVAPSSLSGFKVDHMKPKPGAPATMPGHPNVLEKAKLAVPSSSGFEVEHVKPKPGAPVHQYSAQSTPAKSGPIRPPLAKKREENQH